MPIQSEKSLKITLNKSELFKILSTHFNVKIPTTAQIVLMDDCEIIPVYLDDSLAHLEISFSEKSERSGGNRDPRPGWDIDVDPGRMGYLGK